VTGSVRFLLIVLTISSLVALPCCERRDKSATDLVGAKYVAYRRTLQDFEVRAYVLVVDPGPDGYMQTENKLTNVTNSLSNGQRLDSAVSVLATYNGVLKQAAEEMDAHLEKLKDAGLAVIEAVHRLPRASQPSKVETDANSLVDTADKLASSLHTCKDVRQRLLQDIIDMKGDVRGVFAQRVALGKADEWPKLQAGRTEQFDRFQQQKKSNCVRTMRHSKERLASRLTSTMPIHLLDRSSLPSAPLRGSRVARRSRTPRARHLAP
jgi:hypothetical protein